MATRRNAYVYGSTAEKIDIQKRMEDDSPARHLSHEVRRNREKAARMNLGYVAFLLGAMLLTSAVLLSYIRLQAKNVTMAENISALESELNQMRLANEEEYSRVTSSVDLEEVKKVAIDELGMQYAQEGQVVQVEDSKSDYVHQYQEMP